MRRSGKGDLGVEGRRGEGGEVKWASERVESARGNKRLDRHPKIRGQNIKSLHPAFLPPTTDIRMRPARFTYRCKRQ